MIKIYRLLHRQCIIIYERLRYNRGTQKRSVVYQGRYTTLLFVTTAAFAGAMCSSSMCYRCLDAFSIKDVR